MREPDRYTAERIDAMAAAVDELSVETVTYSMVNPRPLLGRMTGLTVVEEKQQVVAIFGRCETRDRRQLGRVLVRSATGRQAAREAPKIPTTACHLGDEATRPPRLGVGEIDEIRAASSIYHRLQHPCVLSWGLLLALPSWRKVHCGDVSQGRDVFVQVWQSRDRVQ